MKKTYYYFLLLFSSFLYSQTNGITYQAVILNPAGEKIPGYNNDRTPLVNKLICLRFKIYASSLLEYQETISTTTDDFGMVNLIIGSGIYTGGSTTTLAGINWDGNPKNLVIELDTTNLCGNFTEISNQPFTYVPYAFYAANSGSSDIPGPQGASGTNGKNALIKTTTVPKGTNCGNGGVKFETGIDNNTNGILETTEINNAETKYICNGIDLNSSGSFTHYIGELFGGGIIVSLWIANGVEHGLIASLNDLASSSTWSNVSTAIGISAQSYTDGRTNTKSIINQLGHTNSAAKLCDDYVVGVFNDWYLPSILELQEFAASFFKINLVLGDLNGLKLSDYQSSTENPELPYLSIAFNFGNASNFGPIQSGKTSIYNDTKVRAVRNF